MNTSIINITTIVFDDKLKSLIKILKEELKNEISVLQKENDIEEMATAQESIRSYFIMHKNK
jgi:hypothetical protein